MSGFHIYIPTRTLFGAGMLNELHRQKLPGTKAMIVTTAGKSVRENGALARAGAVDKGRRLLCAL